MKQSVVAVLLMIGLLAGSYKLSIAQDATEIMKRSHLAYYYAGDDGIGEVRMSIIDKKGRERLREFTMLRLDLEDGGNQKYYTYFRKPSDISRLTFMVHKNAEGNDSRWIYVPSVDLVKRISADDKNSSFVGSDFSYEDISGRHWTEDKHELIGDSTIDSFEVYMVQSTPREKYKGFARKISYVDKKSMLPIKEEYFDKNDKMIKVFRAEKIETIDSIVTVMVRSMEDLKKNRKTTITFSSITYNAGLKEKIFTERFLKNPPREYIK